MWKEGYLTGMGDSNYEGIKLAQRLTKVALSSFQAAPKYQGKKMAVGIGLARLERTGAVTSLAVS